MKKWIFALSLLIFSGCLGTEAPPEEAQAPILPDILLDEQGNLVTPEAMKTGEAPSEDIVVCREENANIALELQAAQTKAETCEADLAEAKLKKDAQESSALPLPPQFSAYVRAGILSEQQKEYAFSCGQIGNFLKKGWFEDFSTKLLAQKIRFANGYLEASDFLGACESPEGKMAFFLGAERDDTLSFFLVKYDFSERKVMPAFFFDGVETAIVTSLGKRDGPVIRFSSDDGRTLLYYYDANVVMAE